MQISQPYSKVLESATKSEASDAHFVHAAVARVEAVEKPPG